MPEDTTREPFAEATDISQDSRFGAGDAAHTPLEIRNLDGAVDPVLHDWVHERLGRQLGPFALQIERIEVRFGDENGHKGGIDRACLVHLILSVLPPIAIEERGETDREAFDLAAGRAERALKHSLQKHGFKVKHKRREREQHGMQPPTPEELEAAARAVDEGAAPVGNDDEIDTKDSLYGRREGRGAAALEIVQAGLKAQPSADTSRPQVSAEMRQVESGHTAKRNAKLNTAGMAYDLEDSTTGRPSRKSTRRSKNRIKPAAGLTQRTKSRIHSPGGEAMRASRKHS